MRTGFVPVIEGQGGGIYQYSQTMLKTLLEWRDAGRHEIILFTPERGNLNGGEHDLPLHEIYPHRTDSRAVRFLKGLPGARIACGTIDRARRVLWEQEAGELREHYDVIQHQPAVRRHLHRKRVSIMIYPMPTPLSFEAGIPYMMAVHDLQHRLQPWFPEVSANGEWEYREYLFRNGIRKASIILVDSEVGREDVLEIYGGHGATADRIRVLPFLPATYLSSTVPEGERRRIEEKYSLPADYLFYPAQFWPHKNHLGIVRALGILKAERGITPPILFCGAATDAIRERNFTEVVDTARHLGVESQIHYIGYVPDGDMSALYAGAVGLVMPTFFGPTNIPVLEAWIYGCPVLTSDIRGIREQAGDAALLVDPASPESIASGIEQIVDNRELCSELALRGRRRLAGYSRQDYTHRLHRAFQDAVEFIASRREGVTLSLIGLISSAFLMPM